MTGRVVVVAVAVALVGGCAKPPALDRGLLLYEQGRYRRALAAFDEAVREQPSAAAYANRGATRMRLRDTTGGMADFSSALALSPNDAEVLFNRGNARIVAGDPGGAIADFTSAVEIRPEFALALFNRGIARLRSGDALGARADWSAAMTVAKDPAVRTAMERRAEALGRAAGVPSADPGDGRALASRALDRELAGDHAGAVADLKLALTIERDPERRAAFLDLLRLWEDAQ